MLYQRQNMKGNDSTVRGKTKHTCEVVFGPAYMGHRMHVVRAVTQRAAAEYVGLAGQRERENKENRRGIFLQCFS